MRIKKIKWEKFLWPPHLAGRLVTAVLVLSTQVDVAAHLLIVTYLDSMVFLVTHVDKSEGVRGDAPRVVKFAVSSALASERSEETTLRVKHLEKK